MLSVISKQFTYHKELPEFLDATFPKPKLLLAHSIRTITLSVYIFILLHSCIQLHNPAKQPTRILLLYLHLFGKTEIS